ncbi:hypothetical protein [Antricoccus suffuscus]|nr:hypothetical protein [Antricoccus suffuscus]
MSDLHRGKDSGAAIVEFVLLVVIIFVPLTYGVAAFSAIQRAVFASSEAARQAGRAIATAPDQMTGLTRATYAASMALNDQGIDPTDFTVWTAPRGASCRDTTQRYQPTLGRSEVFVVCVRVTIRVPLVPEFIDTNTSTGKFIVAMDSFR